MSMILQITPYYPPHLGGLERVVENLAAGLGQRHRVRVLTTTIGSGTTPRRSNRDGVEVVRHRSVEVAHTPVVPGLLASLLRAPRSAVLHLHSAHALLPELVALAAFLRGQAFLIHFHLDVDATGRWGWLLPAYKKHVFGRVLRAAAGVIVLTRAQADFIRETYRVRPDRLFVVPNGVGRHYFMPPRPVRPEPDRTLRLLFVGRLSPQKNVTRLLRAMALVRRPIELTVVGDGEDSGTLRALTERLGLDTVRFAGPLLGDELVMAYRAAEAFVISSDKEGMPLVALEAMAAGLPVIATDVPGNRELLGGIAMMSDPDPAALAACLDAVAADPELAGALARQSRAAAEAFSWEAVVRRVEDVYAAALS